MPSFNRAINRCNGLIYSLQVPANARCLKIPDKLILTGYGVQHNLALILENNRCLQFLFSAFCASTHHHQRLFNHNRHKLRAHRSVNFPVPRFQASAPLPSWRDLSDQGTIEQTSPDTPVDLKLYPPNTTFATHSVAVYYLRSSPVSCVLMLNLFLVLESGFFISTTLP